MRMQMIAAVGDISPNLLGWLWRLAGCWLQLQSSMHRRITLLTLS
jgi:hypothetical protein